MPRLTKPPAMPGEVARTIETIGNHARTEILRQLATHGPLTATELADRLEATRPGIHNHLTALEAHGLIAGDIDPAQRQGRTVRWTVIHDAVEAAAATWLRYATGR